MTYTYRSIINVTLRGGALGSRLILTLMIAKYFGADQLGVFGLFFSLISFGIIVLGADYYVFSIRELLGREASSYDASFIIQHHLTALIFNYSILIPLLYILFTLKLFTIDYFGWFVTLLLAEHLSQEIFRILNSLNRQLSASTVFFIRTGAWIYVVLPVVIYFDNSRELPIVFALWFAGCLISIIIGTWLIISEINCWKLWKFDKKWLFQGMRIGVKFLIASLCIKGLMTFDRYIIGSTFDNDTLGVYVFFIGIAMTLINLLEPSVFSLQYPNLVKSYRVGEYDEYQKRLKRLILSTISVSFALISIILLFTPYLLEWINDGIYLEHIDILWILLLAAFFYAISMNFQFALYAQSKDKQITLSSVSGLTIYLTITIILYNNNIQSLEYYASALTISFLCMSSINMYFLLASPFKAKA